ncbi:hypothetical protein [Luteimonas sp. A501]
MGAERIRYAFLYIANRVAAKLSGKVLVEESQSAISSAVRNDDLLPRWKRQLTHMMTASRNPKIDEIVFDVLGFSRGAAAARSFLNQAVRTLELAEEAGYSAPADWMSLVGGVLKQGAGAVEALQDHPDVKSGRTGADLWRAMMADEHWPRLASELGESDVREEHGSTMRETVE